MSFFFFSTDAKKPQEKVTGSSSEVANSTNVVAGPLNTTMGIETSWSDPDSTFFTDPFS